VPDAFTLNDAHPCRSARSLGRQGRANLVG
jgi:hypothetical protein